MIDISVSIQQHYPLGNTWSFLQLPCLPYTFMSGAWYILYVQLENRFLESEITVHGCPDKVSDQILNC